MDDDELTNLEYWINLSNSRGIAGVGARETNEDKIIVEISVMEEFAASLQKTDKVSIDNISTESPPKPDLSCVIGDKKILVEITEFIDEALIKQAKHIRSDPKNPLHEQGLWFDTNYEWFSKLLYKTIIKKDQRYEKRDNKIDVLLIWNEATQISIENIDIWMNRIDIPKLKNIRSVYFQSWYHPSYLGRPIWSLVSHQEIGPVRPRRKPVEV